jgi:hypothetical protein
VKKILKSVKTIPKRVKITLMSVNSTLTSVKQIILKDKTSDKTLMNVVYTLKSVKTRLKNQIKNTLKIRFFGRKSNFFAKKYFFLEKIRFSKKELEKIRFF